MLKDRKDNEDANVPKIGKALPLLKWMEAFDNCLSRTIGSRAIPCSHATREDDTAPATAPPLMANEPHSKEFGSMEADLVHMASHNHPLFGEDNAEACCLLEEAT